MSELIPLDAPEARDRRIVGGKAARLAVLRSAGLPVLPGWVVPASASANAVGMGSDALARSGHAAARLVVASAPVDATLVAVLEERVRALGERAVVRSSLVDEQDARWSGAFTSYLDVRAGDVTAALRGCWASLFSRDVAARCEHLGVRASELRMAVLVQPHLDLRSGGMARVTQGGRVIVSSVPACPAGLMAGRRAGTVTEIEPQDRAGRPEVTGDDRTAAQLAAAVLDATGDDTIEWGITASGGAFVLQASATRPTDRSAPTRHRRVGLPAGAVALADLVARFPGPLGEALVLPWAVALESPPDPAPTDVPDAVRGFADVRARSAQLAAETWGLPGPDAVRASQETFRALRGADAVGREAAIERIDGLRRVDPLAGASAIASLRGIAGRLERTEMLRSAGLVWHVEPDALGRALAFGERARVVTGPDRWEPLLIDVVAAHGMTVAGDGVAPGAAAGAVRTIGPGWYVEPPARRQVLVAASPSPQLAPLLWGCAGLVTTEGSLGAHLFEVARALGVPAVAGVSLPAEARRDGTVVAVDGDAGTVGVLPARHPSTGGRAGRFARVGARS